MWQMANASPLTHSDLYKDHIREPSVFGVWARAMLFMLKLDLVIALQKQFLDT